MTDGRIPATCHLGLPSATRNGCWALKGKTETGRLAEEYARSNNPDSLPWVGT